MQKEKFIIRIKRILENKIIIAFGVNIVFLLFFSGIFGIHFETNDDSGMAFIPAGSTGKYSSKLVFINVIVGKILMILTRNIPFINWYTIFQVIIVFLSLSCISYILLKKQCHFGIIAVIFLVSYIGFEGYVNMQFTKTAGVGAVAGILAISFVLENRNNILLYIIGCILLVAGSCYRFEACGLALIFFCIVGVIFLYKNIRRKVQFDVIIKYILGWIIPLFLVLGFKMVDSYAYNSVDDYNEFRKYNVLRAELLDHGFPDYDSNQSLYQELNISREDLQLFQNWNFADPEIFNIDSMKKLIAAKEKKHINIKFIAEFFENIIEGVFLEQSFIVSLICSIILMMFDKRLYKIFIWNIVVYLFIEFYFYYTDRYLLHRVEVVICLAEMILMLFYCNTDIINLKINLRQYILILGFSVVINGALYTNRYISIRKDWDYYREILEKVNSDDEHLYVFCTLDELASKSYDAVDAIPFGIRDNTTLLGGWGTELPTEKFVLFRYDIENPFKDIVNNDKVYIAAFGDLQPVVEYIQRHYYNNAYLEYVYNLNSLNVYKISTWNE